MFESMGGVSGGVATGSGAPAESAARVHAARAALAGVERRVGAPVAEPLSPSGELKTREHGRARWIPVDPGVSALMPEGLRCGAVTAVTGATSLVLALVARASREGSWVAVIGMPQVGLVAAVRRGIELNRLALIPHPGADAAAVTGACLDGMDVVILGPNLVLSDADRRRIVARARERGVAVLSAGPWAGAHTTLCVESSRWSGLGAGYGTLRGREVSVSVRERAGGKARHMSVLLDHAQYAYERPQQRNAAEALSKD